MMEGSDDEQSADGDGLAQRFQGAGLGFYAVEYPGYGLAAEQGPTGTGIYAAAETALEHLHPEAGRASGAHSAARAVTRLGRGGRDGEAGPRLAAGAHHSLHLHRGAGARLFSWLPASLLVRDPFDSATKAPQVEVADAHRPRDAG